MANLRTPQSKDVETMLAVLQFAASPIQEPEEDVGKAKNDKTRTLPYEFVMPCKLYMAIVTAAQAQQALAQRYWQRDRQEAHLVCSIAILLEFYREEMY